MNSVGCYLSETERVLFFFFFFVPHSFFPLLFSHRVSCRSVSPTNLLDLAITALGLFWRYQQHRCLRLPPPICLGFVLEFAFYELFASANIHYIGLYLTSRLTFYILLTVFLFTLLYLHTQLYIPIYSNRNHKRSHIFPVYDYFAGIYAYTHTYMDTSINF